MIIGWDLATKKCGWCAGAGDKLPVAGAFVLSERADLGAMGGQFRGYVLGLHKRFPASHWVVEKPLLVPTDLLWTLERIYGLFFLLHTLANALGIVCKSVPYDAVKREWAGPGASKDDMVTLCAQLGITLPATKDDGREDAADACGVWKVGIRHFAKQHLTSWDAAVYRRQGGLI